MIGAHVWATVKTEDEKLFIMQQFSLVQDRIWFAGGTCFADRILSVTKGEGVHVVFNAATDQRTLRATWKCLGRFGRFVIVGSEQTTAIDMPSAKNATIFSADISALTQHRPRVVHRLLADVASMSRYGQILPLQRIKSFSASETVAALQYVSTKDGICKAVIVPKEEDCVVVSMPISIISDSTNTIKAPRVQKDTQLLRKDATYVLIGGTGGLGRSMAEWMVGKGAKHIVLLSRSGTVKGQAAEHIAALNTAGANIIIRSCDVSKKADVESLILRELTDLPPVRGVIHGAMVLHVSQISHSRMQLKLTLRRTSSSKK